MLRHERDGIVTYQFEGLDADGLVHAVFARLGGVSSGAFATLNVGYSSGDDPEAVGENHRRIYAHLGIDAQQVVSPHQVHGNHVALVTARDAGRRFENTDGLITRTPGIALLLRFADCQPILLYDAAHHAMGLVHAGWRGIAQGIAYRAVEAMERAFGTRPVDLRAALGPAIGPCCYTVGHQVAAAMGYALPNWQAVMESVDDEQWRLDLPGANAQQLTAAGVTHIEQAGLCTSCHSDEFFSHRAHNGTTGRFAVMLYLEPRSVSDQASTIPPGLDDRMPDSLHPPGLPSFGEES
ncbi:MAG: peptidoglycan editing factor PgeF [Anaerolineae bacterium]|nr:peptidoglycan editing factor PgeF [Anaerolineae bacterium]